MQVAFQTAEDLSLAVESVFQDIPVLLYHRLDSVAPYPGFQSHNGIEMYYIESGQGLYLAGDKTYPLQPGTLMIIRPFTLHKVLQTDTHMNICRSVLMWKEELLREDWPSHEPFPLDDMPADCCRIQFEPELQERIRGIYRSLHEEWGGRKPGYLSVIRCLIKELLLLAHRSWQSGGQEQSAPPSEELPEDISYLVQYISNHFQSELPLETLGSLVHMNPSYLSTLFHKHMGLTLTRFIAVKRIHYAKKLLRETTLSVTDIAYQCGFNHHTYFNKTFKRLEQMSPASYRKEHKPRA
ncbi:MAG: hypothetical protein K0R57_4864 [Paenibacillaceae bacterium]|jgi:AraC-like DNA-binding protein|nr:hypothetical protein [Paenibacillaceae bacterium]